MSWLVLLAAAAQAGTPYTADGAEPFWSLEMANGRMIHRYDGREIDMPMPRARRTGAGRRYWTERLVVTIRPERCEDESEQVRADRVDVIADGIAFSGCGGPFAEASSLNQTSWLIVEIAGETTDLTGDPLRDDRYAIDFGADRFVGYGGCNRLSAGYVMSGSRLTPGPVMSTRRACPEPAMGRERRLLDILSDSVEVSFPDRETLILANSRGSVRLRRND